MKTTILISTTLGNEAYISDIKGEITKYLGVRMIEENPSSAPLVKVNTVLEDKDKKAISEIADQVFESAAIFMIESDEEFGKVGNMCTLIPKP